MLTTSCEMDKGLKFGRVMFFSQAEDGIRDRKGTRLNSSHLGISYAVFCLKKKKLIQGMCLEIIRKRDLSSRPLGYLLYESIASLVSSIGITISLRHRYLKHVLD